MRGEPHGRATRAPVLKALYLFESMTTPQIPELKALIQSANDFIEDNGKSNIQALNGYAISFKNACVFFGKHPTFSEIADEWIAQINRHWNEWGTEKNPLSKSEFKAWLRNQIQSLQ